MDPISYFQAIVLGALQGFSELFPISSLGHSVVLPRVFGWDIHQNDDYFLSFLVATHCATAIVLFFFFIEDWKRILSGLGRSVRDRYVDPEDTYAKLGWLLVVGTIPAGLLGLLLEHPLRSLFASTQSAAFFLFVNGLLLFAFEALRRRAPVRSKESIESDDVIAHQLNFKESLGIGAMQALALVPGLSRSGASMGGGLLAGLSNEEAARFAFLLATPIIGAAGLLKLPELLGSQGDHVRGQALVGAIFAAITAWFSVRFLLRYFETNRLTPFAIYCCVAGAVLSIAFALT
jgi:undecaprenyl-diphosphatase